MHQLAPLIYDLTIMLGVAGIVTLLCQRIHQPIVLGYLIAGIIIGPHTPPYGLVSDVPSIKTLSELGVVFLMFSLGLEFSFQKLTRVGFSAAFTALFEVVLMVFIGYWLGIAMGWSYYQAIFLGAALSISSTTIIIKAIQELQLQKKRFAELIFGILIVEDLVAILLLVALSTWVTTQNVFSIAMVLALGKLILVVGGWFLIGYFFVPTFFRRVGDYINQETLTIIAVACCLALVCAAVYFDYSPALGAFIMGSILAETHLAYRIEELIRPIRDIFAAVFFISIGMLIDPKVIIEYWEVVLLISSITIIGKLLSTGIAALVTGQSVNTSLRVGFGMAQIGEFSFIIVALGLTLNVTTNTLYSLIVAVSTITTFATPYLIRLSGYIDSIVERRLPASFKHFLAAYDQWLKSSDNSPQRKTLISAILTRMICNGIMVAIIFVLVDFYLFPRLLSFWEHMWITDILSLLTSLTLASPFIWGMLFSYKKVSLSMSINIHFSPMVFLIWFITLTEIGLLGIALFESWVVLLLFILVGAGFFIFSYRHLESSYHWLERQVMRNIKHDESSKERK